MLRSILIEYINWTGIVFDDMFFLNSGIELIDERQTFIGDIVKTPLCMYRIEQ